MAMANDLDNKIDLSTGQVLPKGFNDVRVTGKTKKVERTQYLEELWWEKHYTGILKKKRGTAITKALNEVQKNWSKKYSKYTSKQLEKFFNERKLFVTTKEDKKFLKLFTKELTKTSKSRVKEPDVFDEDWKGRGGWYGFLGTENKNEVDKKRIRDVIIRLREHWSFYKIWTDGSLYRWFDAEGCFKDKNLFRRSYFNNFMDLRKTPQGRKALLYWARTERFDKPYGNMALTDGGIVVNPEGKKIDTQTLITKSKDRSKIIDEDNIDARKLLKDIRNIDYSALNPKTFDQHVVITCQFFWKSAVGKENKIRNSVVAKIKKEKLNGNKFHDTVVKTFLSEYDEVKNIKVPDGWNPKIKPTLMQFFNAWIMTQIDGFFNMSGSGRGKTIAGILSTRVVNSKYTLIVCSNSILEQWREQLLECFPNSVISVGKIPHKFVKGVANYHIINYEKFSIKDVRTTISKIKQEPIDFLILDEAQNIKVRDDETKSLRRYSVDHLIRKLAKLKNIKVLCLSATPVINNIKEGKSMLELCAHNDKELLKALENVGETSTVRNASSLHTLFLPYCMRFMGNLNIEVIGLNEKDLIEVTSYLPEGCTLKDLEKMHWLNYEQIALEGKIPEIIKRIKGKTIIYCEYVTGIVEKLQQRLEEKGYSVGIYTGKEKSGKDPFLNNGRDVLICSSALSEGFDGLQKVSGNIIFAVYPFTYAKFEQVIGRLIRKGRSKSKGAKKARVRVHLIMAKIKQRGGTKVFEYDLKVKWNRLLYKNQQSRCVTDGENPEKIKLPKKAEIRKSMLELMVVKESSLLPTRKEARKLKVPVIKKKSGEEI
ncbi:MAG: SNF2-related protein [Patescibacteria group bacterium]|nr:SNF2-related protein [Patescibacteria group bacterium]